MKDRTYSALRKQNSTVKNVTIAFVQAVCIAVVLLAPAMAITSYFLGGGNVLRDLFHPRKKNARIEGVVVFEDGSPVHVGVITFHGKVAKTLLIEDSKFIGAVPLGENLKVTVSFDIVARFLSEVEAEVRSKEAVVERLKKDGQPLEVRRQAVGELEEASERLTKVRAFDDKLARPLRAKLKKYETEDTTDLTATIKGNMFDLKFVLK